MTCIPCNELSFLGIEDTFDEEDILNLLKMRLDPDADDQELDRIERNLILFDLSERDRAVFRISDFLGNIFIVGHRFSELVIR